MHIQTGIETDQLVAAGSAVADMQVVNIVLTSDAHGAFVWGVLDRLLDEPALPSATSRRPVSAQRRRRFSPMA